MPVLKIFYHESLDGKIREHESAIAAGLGIMMREIMCADPAKCQIIMTSAAHVSPLPVYVDLQFRANETRTDVVISKAMAETARLIQHHLGSGVRIRAFDIDQAGLHALDIQGDDIE